MQFLKNVTAAFTANAVTAGAQYVLVVLVARGLGPEAFGAFVFALTFGTLAAVVPNFGLDRVLLKQLVREPSQRSAWFASAASLRLVLAILGVAAATALIPWVAPHGTARAVFLILLSLVFALGAELCRSVFYAAGAMPLEAVYRATGRLLTLAAAVAAVVAGGTLDHLAAALAGAALLEAALYGWITARRFAIGWTAPDRAMLRTLAAAAAPIALNTLFVLVYFRASVLMVTAWSGVEAAGQFGAAFTFLQVLQVASGAFATVVLPYFVRQQTGGTSIGPRVDAATRLLLLTIVPVAAALSLLAPEVVRLVYSARFDAAAPVLQVLAWASVFMFLGSLHGTLLIALDAERVLLWLGPLATVVSLTANALLIRRFGIVGAAWATLATEALVGVVCLLAVRDRIGSLRLRSLAWPVAIGAAVSAVLLSAPLPPLPVRALIAAAAAAAAALGLRVVAGPAWHTVWQAVTAKGSARG